MKLAFMSLSTSAFIWLANQDENTTEATLLTLHLQKWLTYG